MLSTPPTRTTIRLRRVETQKGERLEIVAERIDERVRLDALALESVSWQDDAAAVVDRLGSAETPVPPPAIALEPDGVRSSGERPGSGNGPADDRNAIDSISISNEYTSIEVRLVDDDVEIASVGLEYAVRLDAAALEALASLDSAYALSAFLETPFGPEDVERATTLVGNQESRKRGEDR